jgi:outer membrane biosynthesis protein TonB
MTSQLSHLERKDENIARMLTFAIHAILIALLFLPFLNFPDEPIPPPEKEGLLVSFGLPDQGQGDDKPMTQNEEKIVPPLPPSESKPEKPEKTKVEEVKVQPKPENTKPSKAPDPKVITTEDPDVAALKKKQKEDAIKAEEEVKAKKAIEAEAKRQADAETSRKKAEADAAAKEKADLENAKKQYGDVFGTGKGKTGKPGNQGDPNGDPNADNLKGISTGSGKVGGGLGGRGVTYEPTVTENSQKTGRVVVNVCVDSKGKVISSKYTQKGSTTTDATLRQIAEDSALKFKFSASDADQQCGTITYDFKVK